MPQKTAQQKVTVKDLEANPHSFTLFERYSKRKPTVDAIPVLRHALTNPYHGIVKCAAYSLRKLGPLAHEATDDLLAAAARIDSPARMPQAYPECVTAMAAIDPRHVNLLPLIKQFMGLDNWVPIIASLKALKAINTTEATDLLRRAAEFWLPELNNMQRRVVEQLLDDK